MGDVKGHVLPGTMFILFGVWWAVCSIRRYLMCRKSNKSYTSTISFSCPCPCGKLASLPVEGFFKVTIGLVGMLGELIFNLPHPSMGIIQHATMYFFLIMSGIVDILMHYKTVFPPGTDYFAMALAVMVEGVLFANHLHGRPLLDVHIHTLLVYVVFLTVVVVILEAKFKKSFLLTLCRSFLTILHGTWFWALGIILYTHGKPNTAWDLDSHEDAMSTTIYFTWHCAAIFIFLLFLMGIMSCVFQYYSGPISNGITDRISLTTLEMGAKGNGNYSILRVRDEEEDEESDIEFEKPVEK